MLYNKHQPRRMNINSDYTKRKYDTDEMVSYFQKLTSNVGTLLSEKILLSRYLKSKRRILDIGCGTGRSINFFQAQGCDVLGIDISPNMIRQAKKNFPKDKFLIDDISTTTLPKQKQFHIIYFSFNGLMTIPLHEERITTLNNIRDLLSDDGYFIFSTPYVDNKLTTSFWGKKLYETNPNDVFIEESGIKDMFIHVPYLDQVRELLNISKYNIDFESPRLSICEEPDEIEELLDDNYYFVTSKKGCQND